MNRIKGDRDITWQTGFLHERKPYGNKRDLESMIFLILKAGLKVVKPSERNSWSLHTIHACLRAHRQPGRSATLKVLQLDSL